MKNNLDEILIRGECTIRAALKAINSDVSVKLAVVVNGNRKILGVVTDGDIRRALLSNFTLESSVYGIMNKTPVTVKSGISKNDLLDIMNEKGMFSIPVVDGDGYVVSIETYHDVLLPPIYENPIFIMAGGIGTRLKPLTDNCPKPLLEVGGRPLLETILVNFKNAGFRNFFISTHYLPWMIKEYFGNGNNWGVNITYIHEEVPLGTGGAVSLLPKDISDLPMLIMNGDVLTTVDFQNLLEFHTENKATATMCVREYEYRIPYGVITGDGKRIISMQEKPLQRLFINAGIYVIDQKVIRTVEKNRYVDMPTLLEQHIKNDDSVLMFPIHEYWLDIGRIDDFNKAQNDYAGLGFVQ